MAGKTMKKLLVLDLDETLIHSSELLLDRDPDFTVFDYFVYRRPYLTQYLHFCGTHFSVAVWSSASDDYVRAITQKIFPDPAKLIVVWGVSKTTIRRRHPEDYDRFGQPLPEFHYLKRLQKLTKLGWSLADILIVDDSPEKCLENFGNAIHPTPFFGSADDDELKYLAGYLFGLKDSNRIRRIEKRGWRGGAVPMAW